MSTFLGNKTISKTTPLRKENPFPQFNVASHKRPGIRLSFEYTTTLLSGEGGEGRTGTATMFRKMLSKYTIFSTVLSKIVAYLACNKQTICNGLTDHFTKVATQIHYNAHTQVSLYYQAWEGRHLPHVITKNPSLPLLMQAPEPQYAL